MKKQKILALILLLSAVALTVVSFLLLPDTVITQFGSKGNVTTLAKPLAIAMPALLSAVPAGFTLFNRDEAENKTKPLLVSVIGIAVFIVMLVVNTVA
ncbi:MAG: hypothetical protein GXW99_01345 [Clostridiales bacterium]|nr:hypothetical protein [Clostridiales bacterium]